MSKSTLRHRGGGRLPDVLPRWILEPDLTPDVVFRDEAQAREFHGPRAVRALLRALIHDAFPGATTGPPVLLADPRAVACAFRLEGRHQGRFMGIPPTGRWVVLPMAILGERHRGRIRRGTLYYDAGSLLRQLGLGV